MYFAIDGGLVRGIVLFKIKSVGSNIHRGKSKSKAVGSRADGRVHFLSSYKENEPKEIRP